MFADTYQSYKATGMPVFIYGDPAGLYGTGDGLVLSYYEKIRQVLIKEGFQVKVMMKKPPKEQKDNPLRERIKIPVDDRIEATNTMLCSGEDPPLVRIKINPRCINLIKSLAELEFTEDGKNIDKTVDKKAGRATDKNKALLMTHPTDALGYYIYKRFPTINKKKGVVFFQTPGDSTLEFRDGKKSIKQSGDMPDWLKEKKAKRDARKRRKKKSKGKER